MATKMQASRSAAIEKSKATKPLTILTRVTGATEPTERATCTGCWRLFGTGEQYHKHRKDGIEQVFRNPLHPAYLQAQA